MNFAFKLEMKSYLNSYHFISVVVVCLLLFFSFGEATKVYLAGSDTRVFSWCVVKELLE